MEDFPSDENSTEETRDTQQPSTSKEKSNSEKKATDKTPERMLSNQTLTPLSGKALEDRVSQLRMWGIVIGGSHVHAKLLLPQKRVKDKNGKFKFYNGAPVFDYVPFNEIRKTVVERFATRKEVIDKTDPKVNAVFTSLKQLMRDSTFVAVSYHAKNDPCSKCYGNHYHILLADYGIKDLNKNYRYRELRKLIPTEGEKRYAKVYCTYQRVKEPRALFCYMIRPPRLFYGANSQTWIDIANNPSLQEKETRANEDETAETVEIDEIIGVETKTEEDDGFPEIDISAPEEPPDQGAIFLNMKRPHSSDDDELPKEKAPRVEGGEFIGRMVEIGVHLMNSCRTTDKTKMRLLLEKKIKKGSIAEIDQLKRYKDIMYCKQKDRIWDNAITDYRCKILSKTFRELMTDTWFAVEDELNYEREFIPLNVSVKLLINWCKEMGMNPKKFTNQCKHVLSRKHGKHNTIFLMGVSNAGKTVMFTRPLEYIMEAVGRIASINLTDRFIFEGCVGQRLISIEECEIPKIHMEDVKKIMGGEEIIIQVKYVREGAILSSCPVIATSNRIPWNFDLEQEVPLRNRMYYYELSKPFDELASWENKKLDPRAYLLAWNTRAIAPDFDFEDLIDNDVLECAIDTIREKFVNCRLDG